MLGYKTRKILNKCVQCGKPLGDSNRSYCPQCTKLVSDTNRRRAQYREACGMCKTCGEWLTDKDRLANGQQAKNCKACRDKKASYQKMMRRK